MQAEELTAKLNEYPMWTQVDEMTESEQHALSDTVSALAELFRRADAELRARVCGSLNCGAKYMMYQYTWRKAIEARRTGAGEAIAEGLTPVVMGAVALIH